MVISPHINHIQGINDVRIIWFQINKLGFMSENAKWMLHEFNYIHCNLNVLKCKCIKCKSPFSSLKLVYIVIPRFLLLFSICCSEFPWLLIYFMFFPLGTSAVCHFCHGEHQIWSARCHGYWGTRLVIMLLTSLVLVTFHIEWHCKKNIFWGTFWWVYDNSSKDNSSKKL